MSDTKLLEAILDAQKAIKEELKNDIIEVKNVVLRVEKKVDENCKRIDKLL